MTPISQSPLCTFIYFSWSVKLQNQLIFISIKRLQKIRFYDSLVSHSWQKIISFLSRTPTFLPVVEYHMRKKFGSFFAPLPLILEYEGNEDEISDTSVTYNQSIHSHFIFGNLSLMYSFLELYLMQKLYFPIVT